MRQHARTLTGILAAGQAAVPQQQWACARNPATARRTSPGTRKHRGHTADERRHGAECSSVAGGDDDASGDAGRPMSPAPSRVHMAGRRTASQQTPAPKTLCGSMPSRRTGTLSFAAEASAALHPRFQETPMYTTFPRRQIWLL